MEFRVIVEQVLLEDAMAGGAGSVFGPGVVSTETPVSGDNYAKGDARNIFGNSFPGMMTRAGMTGKRKKKNKKKYSYKKASKKKSKKKKSEN